MKTDLETSREDLKSSKCLQTSSYITVVFSLIPASLPSPWYIAESLLPFLLFSTKDFGFPFYKMEELDPLLFECPSSIVIPSLVI